MRGDARATAARGTAASNRRRGRAAFWCTVPRLCTLSSTPRMLSNLVKESKTRRAEIASDNGARACTSRACWPCADCVCARLRVTWRQNG